MCRSGSAASRRRPCSSTCSSSGNVAAPRLPIEFMVRACGRRARVVSALLRQVCPYCLAVVALAALSFCVFLVATAGTRPVIYARRWQSASDDESLSPIGDVADAHPPRPRPQSHSGQPPHSEPPWYRLYRAYRLEHYVRGSGVGRQLNASGSAVAERGPAIIRKTCDVIPQGLVGKVEVYQQQVGLAELEAMDFSLRPGGHYEPQHCRPRSTIAVIVPFRYRWEHLPRWLLHMHPFLQRQQLRYTVFVINQEEGGQFNKGMMMNIGFKEALKMGHYNCVIFHDVDLLPENDLNLYACPDASAPRHMSVAVDKFGYALPYDDLVGGVMAFSIQDFKKLNGFSNMFYGWGGEDDDLSARIHASGLRLSRYRPDKARYVMIKHDSDFGNDVNPRRYGLLGSSESRQHSDGLNSLSYSIKQVQFRKLFTWISVAIGQQDGAAHSWFG